MWMTRTPKVSVLIVDDRKEDLLALEQVLASDAYEVVTCNSGPQALREVLTREFAVILLDVNMPQMDGFEVASVIKQRDRSKSTPILFMTAGGHDVKYIYKAYSVGAVDYLVKPIDADVVRAKVRIFAELFVKEERIRQQSEQLLAADRRERERRLAEFKWMSERRYKNLAEAIPELVWTATANGEAQYFNGSFLAYTGMEASEAMGDGWLRAVHEEDASRYLELWEQASAAGKEMELQLRLRSRDGTYRWHLSRLVPDVGKDGAVVGWLGTHTDFDDIKRAHEEAKQAIRLRDEFLSVASHELRTPLSTLVLQLDGLLRFFKKGGLDNGGMERGIAKAEGARRQADRLEKLIASLLDVSRIASGRLVLEPEDVDLEALVHDVVGRLGDDLERSGSTLKVTCSGPISGHWDRLRLEQVVTNLVSNAIKYGLGKPLEVHLEARAEGVRLSVRDHGIGIERADQGRIFERFERAASIHNYGGFGLGLWITRQILDAMNAAIHVESTPGVGTVFEVELPLSVAEAAPEVRKQLSSSPP